MTAAVLTSAAGALVGGTVKVVATGATVAGAAVATTVSNPMAPDRAIAATDPNAYDVDSLFRSDKPAEPAPGDDTATRAEVGR